MANQRDDPDRIEEASVEHEEKVTDDGHQAQGTESFEEMSTPTESDTMHSLPIEAVMNSLPSDS
jgi:hypothetical protein